MDNGILSKEKVNKALSHIESMTEVAKTAKKVDFVVEAIYEDLELKTEIFRQLDKLCPPHTILASNSSILPIDLWQRRQKGQRR